MFADDFKGLPFAQQKARLMEVLEEVRVSRGKSLDVRFREGPERDSGREVWTFKKGAPNKSLLVIS